RRRHTRFSRDWSSDVCSSDLISIPNTYQEVEPRPQGLLAFFKSPIKGIIEAADIIFLVLIIGGLIGIMNLTGAFDAGISWLAKTLKGHEYVLKIGRASCRERV